MEEHHMTAQPNYKEMVKETESIGWNVKDSLKDKSLEELKEVVANDRLPFSVMCLNLTGSLNIGTIIRTSHILGAQRVFVLGRRTYDGRSLVGSDKYFDVIRIDALDANLNIDKSIFCDIMSKYDMTPVLLETGGHDYRDYNWSKFKDWGHMCLVVGNEGLGIPKDIVDLHTPRIVSIEQRGVIRSLNCSSAFAIVCAYATTAIWN